VVGVFVEVRGSGVWSGCDLQTVRAGGKCDGM